MQSSHTSPWAAAGAVRSHPIINNWEHGPHLLEPVHPQLPVKRRWRLVREILMVLAYAGCAEVPIDATHDREFASIMVGLDRAIDVERKWGRCSCFLPSAPGGPVSYLYSTRTAGEPLFIRLEIGTVVDTITVSKDPPVTGMCYSVIRRAVPLRTAKGLGLGTAIGEVLRIYGPPTRRVEEGPLVRLRYWAELDHEYEWDVVFRDGHLIEWTIATEE